MRSSEFVRLHHAGATHRELKLFSEFESSNPDISAPSLVGLVRSGIPQDRAVAIMTEWGKPENAAVPNALKSSGVRIVTIADAEYPEQFRNLPRHPFLLYVRWVLSKPSFSVSVVGSRKASPYGKTVTERFVREFVSKWAVTVSGWAAGIDSAAHEAALRHGGITVAFVGTGIDVDYPRSNRGLFNAIVESGGAVVSAFAPGAGPLAHHFPIRNALVASFSNGTLVTEAAENSGSLITARLALEFGKDVFAVPGDVIRPGSLGANSLIRDGLAKCVITPEDVLCEFGQFVVVNRQFASADCPARIRRSPVFEELARLGSSDPETLSLALKIPLGTVLSELSELEIAGNVASDLFGSYSVR